MTRTHRQQAADFAQWLREQGACREARRWAGGKTLRQAWARCPRKAWVNWLLVKICRDGAITYAQRLRLCDIAYRGRSRKGLLDNLEIIDAEPTP